jgi:hypothetical protein
VGAEGRAAEHELAAVDAEQVGEVGVAAGELFGGDLSGFGEIEGGAQVGAQTGEIERLSGARGGGAVDPCVAHRTGPSGRVARAAALKIRRATTALWTSSGPS